MNPQERFPLPQVIVLFMAVMILLLLLMSPKAMPPGITLDSVDQLQQVLRLGEGSVYNAEWSPNGETIVLVGSAGIWIWDTAHLTAQPRLVDDFTGFVVDVAFDPAGKLLASGHANGVIRLWDTTTWQPLETLESHAAEIWDLLFSPDGRWLATTGHDFTVHLWDTTTWQPVNLIELNQNVSSISFSPDSRYLAFTNEENIYLLDTASGVWSGLLEGSNRLSNRMRSTFDANNLLIAGDSSRPLRMWTVEDGHATSVSPDSVALEPALTHYLGGLLNITLTREQLVVDNATARAWSEIDRRNSYNFDGNVDIKPSPDGRYMIGERISRWELWDLNDAVKTIILHTRSDSFYQIGLFHDDNWIVATSHHNAQIWRFDNGQQTHLDLNQAGGSIIDLLLQGNQPLGLFMDWTGSIRLFDLVTGTGQTIIENIATYPDPVISPDEHYLAINDKDASTSIWDLQTRQIVMQFRPDDAELRYMALAFSPDNHLLAYTLHDRECECPTVMLWDIDRGERKTVLGNVNRYIGASMFSADGSQLFVGGGYITDKDDFYGYVKVWNTETGEEIHTFDAPGAFVQTFAISPDGRYIAATTLSDVWLWDMQADDQPAPEPLYAGELYPLATFNPRGDLLAVGTPLGEIRLFDVASGVQVAERTQHKASILDIDFSADGQTMISSGSDGTLRVWRVDGRSLGRTLESEPVILPTLAITATLTPTFSPTHSTPPATTTPVATSAP